MNRAVVHVIIHVLDVHHRVHGPRIDYVGIGVAAAVSWLGVSGPGEVVLVTAAVAAARGRLDISSVIGIAWVGATLGGMGGWLIGRHGGRRVILAGRWLRPARERALDRGNRFFERYGWVAVYFAPSWAAGINAMSASRFLPANAVCALAWSLLIGLGGYLLGPSIGDISQDIGIAGSVALGVLIVAAALAGRRGIRSRRARPPRGPTPRRGS